MIKYEYLQGFLLILFKMRKSPIYILLFSIALIGGCSSKPYVVRLAEEAPKTGKNIIYVASHGWHTGLILPARPILERLPGLRGRFSNAPFIEFGWGDKGFYQASEITTGLALKAVFWSSGSVIHAVEVTGDVHRFFPDSEVRQLCLTDASLSSMIDFIAASFARNAHGDTVALNSGLYGNSQFYEGIGYYHMFNTCNKWTAKALRSAGMDISPLFKLTAGSIMNYIEGQSVACPEPKI